MSDEKKVDKDFLKNLIIALDNRNVKEKIITIIHTDAIKNNDELSVYQDDDLVSKLQEEIRGLKRANESTFAQYQQVLSSKKVSEDKYKSTISNLELDKSQLQRKLEELENENKFLEDQYQAKIRELEDENDKLKVVMASFGSATEYYNMYKTVSEVNRNYFSNIISDRSPLEFLVTLGNRDNVFSFWDELKYYYERQSENDLLILIKIIDYGIKLVNFNYSNIVYELMEGEEGKEFDSDLHIRSENCSKYQGVIKKVLLPGIWNNIKEEADRKALVEF